MCQAVKCQDFFFIFTLPGFDDSLSLFVSEATVALDNGTGDMRLLDFGVLIQLENHGKTKFLFIRAERTDLVAQAFRQHRNGTVHKINRCRTAESFPVYQAFRFNVVGHVGDMNANFPIAIIQLTGRKGIIEILSVFRVDRESRDATEILTLGNFLFRDCIRYLFCRLLNVSRIFIWQVELSQDSIHLRIVVTGSPQDIDHLTQRVLSLFRPFGDTDDRFVAGLAAFQFVFRNKDVVCKRLVFRNKESKTFGHL